MQDGGSANHQEADEGMERSSHAVLAYRNVTIVPEGMASSVPIPEM